MTTDGQSVPWTTGLVVVKTERHFGRPCNQVWVPALRWKLEKADIYILFHPSWDEGNKMVAAPRFSMTSVPETQVSRLSPKIEENEIDDKNVAPVLRTWKQRLCTICPGSLLKLVLVWKLLTSSSR